MINRLKSKLEELELKKKGIQPKIDEINQKREKEIQDVNKKYDHMIYEVNYEIIEIENKINKELIETFIEVITRELDVKRSSSLYLVTDELKEYRESIRKIESFPQELVEKLHQVINGKPIETIVYELDDIRKKYIID
jgi:hypothetical protein